MVAMLPRIRRRLFSSTATMHNLPRIRRRLLSSLSGCPKTKLVRARELLDVKTDASETDIRNSFRKKCLLCHPDLVRGSVSKAKASEDFVRLTEAAALLLNKNNEQEEAQREQQYSMRRRQQKEQSTKIVTPATMRRSFEMDLRQALRKVKHGPKEIEIDQTDGFPAALEMEERNFYAPISEPLLRLVHGRQAIGYVNEISKQELRLELFDGCVIAQAKRSYQNATADRITVRRILKDASNIESTLISPRNRGLKLFGFGGWKTHYLIDNTSGNVTHRLFEYFYPGVHVQNWLKFNGSGSVFLDPLLATITRASFPLHKRWWPEFFQDSRPDTHASDGASSAYYFERRASAAGIFVKAPQGKEQQEQNKKNDFIFLSSSGQSSLASRTTRHGRSAHYRHSGMTSSLDPVLCVFAAAFHSLDHYYYRSSSTSSLSSAFPNDRHYRSGNSNPPFYP
uniref:J domain-containing protein n=1 Tax=Aureoumbra lagunensis TaxID=44058 RepID=A0A7S3NR48_9STRA|mmetsp:Transcript_7769/g.11766  ORF Transcript_7769/g.11766 Transcript_7769/m.11766 type:complete len:454 (+) Transcript_7769:14-1375(+)